MKNRTKRFVSWVLCVVVSFLWMTPAIAVADNAVNELNNMQTNEMSTFGLRRSVNQGTVSSEAEIVLANSIDIEAKGERTNVLILDNSVSVEGVPLTYLKQAAKKFCSELLAADKNSEIAIIVYDTSIVEICSFTNDINALYATIDSMVGDGSWTNINAAATKAYEMLLGTDAEIKNLIIMTDGLPTYGSSSASGRYTYQDIDIYYDYTGHYVYEFANALYTNVTNMFDELNVYTLGYFHNMTAGQKAFGSKLLNDLQNAGYYEVTNPNDLEFVFGEIADDVVGATMNDPIVVIPGIMGSRLFLSNSVFDYSTRAWDPVVDGSHPFITLSSITQLNERLQMSNTLFVRPCENQNVDISTAIANSTVDDYGREYGAQETYKQLVDSLCNEYAIGTDDYRPVYFFSYDWRQSNTDSAKRLHAEVQNILNETGAEKVDFVCHSMGGLVASKYYVEYGSFEQVDQIITCGTPYEGAPKLINSVMNWDVLGNNAISLNGDDWADIALGIFGGMQTKLKSSFKGVAELTPTQNYVTAIPMQKDHWLPFSIGDYKITFDEYKSICGEIFDSYSSAYAFQESLKDASYNALLKYENAFFVLGINNKTITSIKFQLTNNDIDQKLYESDLGYTTLGDGTVPYLSASICEQLDKGEYSSRVYKISADHSGVVQERDSINWVISKLNNSSTNSTGDALNPKPYIVIRIACPVDVTVSRNSEVLSSAMQNFSARASFGRLDIIGLKDDIKMLCLDKANYPVVLEASDAGFMDYSIRFFDEDEELYREANFEDVPLTQDTVIYTSTDDTTDVILQIDIDGDGVIDEYLTSDEKVQITSQPTDQYVVVGQRATFSIGATGDNVTYQWYINRNKGNGWRKIDGAVGATYITSITDLDCDGFKYYCKVTDQYGNTINSNEAVLHVTTAPVLPETGDSSTPMLWLAMSILSMAGILLLRKKAYSR